jgi:anti-sigma regulatory factor (Ser/Thr protein kinase)
LSARNEIAVVEQIVQEIARFLQQQAGPQEAWMYRFCLCLRETVYNAVMHGNRGSKDAVIDVEAEHHPQARRVVIVVRDGGNGFDWQTALEAQREQDPERPRGRGLIILAEMADSVEVGAGEVRFALALPPAEDAGGQQEAAR